MMEYFKRIVILATLATYIICICSLDVSASTVSDTININTQIVVKESTSLLLGYNQGWSNDNHDFIIRNSMSTVPSADYVKFMKQNGLNIPLSRTGGDCSVFFNWTALLGELEDRFESGYAKNYGIVEWINGVYAVNPDAPFIVVLNMNDPPEKCADLVRFLTLSPDNPNAVGTNGINWAQRRIDLGLQNPVNVLAFELGNELYPKTTEISVAQTITAANEYVSLCIPVISAIKAVNPDAKLSAISFSLAEIARKTDITIAWNSTVIYALRQYISYVTHHDYYTLTHTFTTRDQTYKRITDYIGNYDIKVLVTEHSNLNETYENKAMSSLRAALSVGDFLNAIYNIDSIVAANYHNFFGGVDYDRIWGVVRSFSDGSSYLSPIGELLKLMSEAVGDNVVRTSVGLNRVSASTHLAQDGTLKTVLVNRSETNNVNLSFNFNGDQYKLASKSVLTGNTLGSDNSPLTPDGVHTKRYLVNDTSALSSFVVPAKSIVMLHLLPMTAMPLPNEIGTVELSVVSNRVQIKSKLYNNGDLFNTDLTAVILNPGVQSIQRENVCSVGQTKILNDIAYFDIPMPNNAKPGLYTAVIGNKSISNDFYLERSFYYEPVKDIGVVFSNTEGEITYNEKVYPRLSNSEFKMQTEIDFLNVPDGTVCNVVVVYGDIEELDELSAAQKNRIAHIGQTVVQNNTAAYDFYMPREAMSGVYTMITGCKTENGETVVVTPFYFEKTMESIQIMNFPYDLQGKEIELEYEGVPEQINIPVKSLVQDTLDIKIIAAYYLNNELKGFGADILRLDDNEVHTAQLMCEFDELSLIKIYIWDEVTLEPYIITYYIK